MLNQHKYFFNNNFDCKKRVFKNEKKVVNNKENDSSESIISTSELLFFSWNQISLELHENSDDIKHKLI